MGAFQRETGNKRKQYKENDHRNFLSWERMMVKYREEENIQVERESQSKLKEIVQQITSPLLLYHSDLRLRCQRFSLSNRLECAQAQSQIIKLIKFTKKLECDKFILWPNLIILTSSHWLVKVLAQCDTKRNTHTTSNINLACLMLACVNSQDLDANGICSQHPWLYKHNHCLPTRKCGHVNTHKVCRRDGMRSACSAESQPLFHQSIYSSPSWESDSFTECKKLCGKNKKRVTH